MTDKELINKIMQGEEKAVGEFCRRFRGKLTGLVAKKVERFEDVEEIVQDSLISGLDSLPRFKGSCSLGTWLGAIARHEVADFYRRKKIKKIVFSKLPFLEKLVSQALGPELAYQELETKRKIVKTLKRLSEGYGQILRLKYIEGLSMKEMAERLGTSVKAVESRLFRARLAFQKAYEKEYETETDRWFKEGDEVGSAVRD